ncbi:MAG: hypothetical protein JWR84_996 [Caulobacter sp.]|nr:hypothetical protein [Caulobacter sp.]
MTESEKQPLEGSASLVSRIAWAKDHADWYRRKKREKQRLSMLFRYPAALLLAMGGILPVLPINTAFEKFEIGYLMLLAGGGLLLVDQALGFSKSWVRFMTTAILIENEIEVFKCVSSVGVSTETPIKEATRAADFTKRIGAMVLAETRGWASDFDRGFAELKASGKS